MQTIETIIDWLSRICMVAGGIALTLMMLQVTSDVLLKYIINYPVPATLEIVSSYYMVAVAFLPLGMVTRDRRHVVVELFTAGLSPRRLSILAGVMSLVAFFYVSVLVYRSTANALRMTDVREVWETAIGDIEVWPSRWLVPIGSAVMAMAFLLGGIRELATGLIGRHDDAGAAKEGGDT